MMLERYPYLSIQVAIAMLAEAVKIGERFRSGSILAYKRPFRVMTTCRSLA
jgi:hypothetical protein